MLKIFMLVISTFNLYWSFSKNFIDLIKLCKCIALKIKKYREDIKIKRKERLKAENIKLLQDLEQIRNDIRKKIKK